MISLTTINDTDPVENAPAVINANFSALNTGKLETLTNDGAGAGQLVETANGQNVNIKTLVAGSNISLTNGTSTVTIAASAPNPDASSSVIGITALSVNPVSPTSPIAIGQNDPILNTKSGSALNGTSNKIEDSSDTGTSGANKLLRLDGSGKLPSGLDGSQLSNLPSLGLYKCGVATHDISLTGAQTIAHGLGTTPKYIRITSSGIGTNPVQSSVGTYNGTSVNTTLSWCVVGSSPTFNSGNDTTNIIDAYASTPTNNASAVPTFDGTNITLTWSKTNSPTGTVNFLWEAFA